MYAIVRHTPSFFCFCASTIHLSWAMPSPYDVSSLVGMFVLTAVPQHITSTLAQASVGIAIYLVQYWTHDSCTLGTYMYVYRL